MPFAQHLHGSPKQQIGPSSPIQLSPSFFGGEGEIRTHGYLAASTVFETAAFDHSATSPHSMVTSKIAGYPVLPAQNSPEHQGGNDRSVRFNHELRRMNT